MHAVFFVGRVFGRDSAFCIFGVKIVCGSPKKCLKHALPIPLRVFFTATWDVCGCEFFFVSYVILYSEFNGERISALGPSVLEINQYYKKKLLGFKIRLQLLKDCPLRDIPYDSLAAPFFQIITI